MEGACAPDSGVARVLQELSARARTEAYYDYLRGKLSRGDLFQKFPDEAAAASEEAWQATLGSTHLPKRKIDERISAALASAQNWVLMAVRPARPTRWSALTSHRRRERDAEV